MLHCKRFQFSLRTLIVLTAIAAMVLGAGIAISSFRKRMFIVSETTAVLERMGWNVSVVPNPTKEIDGFHPPRELTLGSLEVATHRVTEDEAFVASRVSNVVRLVFENCDLSNESLITIGEGASELEEIVFIKCDVPSTSFNWLKQNRPDVRIQVR